MRKIIKCFTILLLFFSIPAFADYQSAYIAYEGKDYPKALKEINPLVERGDADAMGLLGWMYLNGLGVPTKYDKALQLLTSSAMKGNSVAQNNLGIIYSNGKIVRQDYNDAAKWYRKAADQGLDWAQFNLGQFYENGLGVPQSYIEAGKWYRKASDQGYGNAQYYLGQLYEIGNGVPKDIGRAVLLYSKAANQIEDMGAAAIAKSKLVEIYAKNPSLRNVQNNEQQTRTTQIADPSKVQQSEAKPQAGYVSQAQDVPNIEAMHAFMASLKPSEEEKKSAGDMTANNANINSISEEQQQDTAVATTEYNSKETPSNFAGGVIIWILLIGGLFGYFNLRGSKLANLNAVSQGSNNQIGIQGWLRFFIVVLGIFSPALNLGRIAGSFHEGETAYAILTNTPAWATYKNTVWLTLGSVSALSIYAALQLRFIWKPSSVTIAKIALVMWPVAGILIGIVIPAMVFTEQAITADGKAILEIFPSIISAAIWITYLSMSKRVRATYLDGHGDEASATVGVVDIPGASVQHKGHSPVIDEVALPDMLAQAAPSYQASATVSATSQPVAGSPVVINSTATEDELYEQIGSELDSGIPHAPTWLKAFAYANGDDKIAKANYIKLRLEKLLLEEQSKLSQIAAVEAR